MPDLTPFAVWWGVVGIIEGAVGLWVGYQLIVLRRRSGLFVVMGSSLLVGWGIPWAFGVMEPTPEDDWARWLTVMFLMFVAGWLGSGWSRVRDAIRVREALEQGEEGNDEDDDG